MYSGIELVSTTFTVCRRRSASPRAEDGGRSGTGARGRRKLDFDQGVHPSQVHYLCANTPKWPSLMPCKELLWQGIKETG